MKFLLKYGLLPIFLLMSFAMSSGSLRTGFGFGIDLSTLIVMGFVFYYLFMYKNRIRGGAAYFWWFYLLVVPTIVMSMLQNGRTDMMLCCTFALMLPFALEPFVPGRDKHIIRGFYLTYVVSAIIMLLYLNLGFLRYWNTNCMAYLLFLGMAGVVTKLSLDRRNLVIWLMLLYAFLQLMLLRSRNVIFALMVVVVLVLFEKTFSKRIPYTIICAFSLLYPAVFPRISYMLRGTDIYRFVSRITSEYFSKQSVLSGRDELFYEAERLLESSFIKNLFGFGSPISQTLSAHNDYYSIRYAYGIIGTIIIAILLIKFFKIAYVLIQRGDKITFGCVAVIIGILIQQASEGWLFGSNIVVLLAFVYMAIVIKRYRISERKRLKNEAL